jgi:hypothetical protein
MAERIKWTVIFFCNDGLGPYVATARATGAKQAVAFACTRMDGMWPRAKRPTFRAVAFPGDPPPGLEAFEGPATSQWLEDVAA